MASMTIDHANRAGEEQLTLQSRMAELTLVPAWIERLAAEHGISESTQFAMNLCLEEILSNIIRHGYGSVPDKSIVVRYSQSSEHLSRIVVEDEAPHFDPLAAPENPIEETLEGTRIGGLGIRLVRNFASSLHYEATAIGNRLIIEFAASA